MKKRRQARAHGVAVICARQRRIEREAHIVGRERCLTSAAEFDLHMSCEDEGECSAPHDCEFFKQALADATAFDEALP